jgi:hypothetical protein
MSTDVANLFPHADTLSLCGNKKINRVRDFDKSGCFISSLVPWSLLRIAYNVHTLKIIDDRGILFRTILHNKDNFGTRINQQVRNSILKEKYIKEITSSANSIWLICNFRFK